MAATQMMPDLTQVEGLILDMDGVLWRGERFLPGVPELFAFLRQRAIPFVLVTNNATASPSGVRAKLRAHGVEVEDAQVLTSAQAAAAWLQDRLPPAAQVYAIGEAGLQTALAQAGFALADRGKGVQAVVVGMDRSITWSKLAEASYAIQAGARFSGTNPDPSFPTEHGLAPGNGAFLAALHAATGVQPVIIGKPEPHLFAEALKRLGTNPRGTLALGDRLETDILGAQRAGLPTALVLTGVTRREDLEQADVTPDWVFEDLIQVRRALDGAPS